NLRIEKSPPTFEYYGPVRDELIQRLTDYFSKVGTNPEETIREVGGLVARITENTIKDFGKDSAWVNVRTTLPNNEFNIPRWHVDGGYFKHEPEDKVYKLVFTIKGPPTRFAEKQDTERFEKLMRE